MPKTIKNCFYKKLTFNKLLQAHYRARKQKTFKNEVIKFEIDLENNIINLLNNIKKNKYSLGKYRSFKIYEPKERIIKSLPYVDRIVHQWYVEEFIKPYIVPKFINTSFACMENRGTHKAVSEVQQQMQMFKRNYGDFWILKCDIHKFFYSINPNILYNILCKYISDKKLLSFSRLLIFDSRSPADKVGIPIGNYTSQFFANIYLNELDYFIKRTLKIHYYTRYMDDFIIILKSKKDCILLKKQIEEFLAKNLELQLNDKSRYYPYKMGVNFCGYRIFATHKLLRTNSKRKIKKNIKKWNYLYGSNQISLSHAIQSLSSWLGHASHCNSYRLQKKIINNCNFIINENYYRDLEKKLISYSTDSDEGNYKEI